MREKLVELLSTADDYEDRVCRSYRRYSCKTCPYKGMDCTYRAKADHLIANGVRLEEKQATSKTSEQFASDNHVGGKWISVKERLPWEEWEYFTEENDWDVYPCLVVVKNNRGGRRVTKMFYTGENFVDDEYVRYTAQVTHWMPLPEPPKGK